MIPALIACTYVVQAGGCFLFVVGLVAAARARAW